jgi:hypothetical protein
MPTIEPPSDNSRETGGQALRRLAVLSCMAALAACKTVPPPAPVPPPPEPHVLEVHCAPALEEQDFAARHFFATQDRLSTLNTADLANEANHPADPGSVQGQLDQALALSLTHTPGDLARAQGLVDQVVHNTNREADTWRAPARLLASVLSEERRADDVAEHSAQQLRDAQRDNQRKLDQLNEKLEQLKAIERSLNTRPGASASRPGP